MVLVGGGGGGLSEKYVFCVPRELHHLLSLFCLWEKLNGGENSLHWKENMLPLFSIMTLWSQLTFPFQPVNIAENTVSYHTLQTIQAHGVALPSPVAAQSVFFPMSKVMVVAISRWSI